MGEREAAPIDYLFDVCRLFVISSSILMILRLGSLSFQNSLVACNSKNGRLQRNKQHRKHHTSLVLLAESAKVRLHGHGDIVPAACPALEVVHCGGGVGGVKERHGNEGGNEGCGWSGEAGDGVRASKAS